MTSSPQLAPDSSRIGVGILGAGPVTQAIHLPTLARLTDTFRVVRLMDVNEGVARSVAARVGAAWTTDLDELLANDEVEIIAICSPHAFHAAQVIAACRAGKRAVLCEKPFAMSPEEAAEIAEVSAQTGVPIVVGAMHAYDPGWIAATAVDIVPRTIRSSIVLPPNTRFEDFATEVLERPTFGPADLGDPDVVAGTVEAGVMGLAIHDLPLIRQLLGRVSPEEWRKLRVTSAEAVGPFGYLITLVSDDVSVELHAVAGVGWNPDWRLTATGRGADGSDVVLDVVFTPSYVQSGSATATISTTDAVTTFPPTAGNGYEGEWRHLAALVAGAPALISAQTLIDDLGFALNIASAATETARADALQRRTETQEITA